MPISRKLLLQVLPLILFLLAGQLQAKDAYLCSMMDQNTQSTTMDLSDEESFCHDHKDCLNLDHDDASSLNTDSCNRNIDVLHTNQDVQLNVSVPDLVTESDVDPPQEKFTTLDLVFQLQAAVPLRGFPNANYVHVGSKIHLITQRLRI